MDRSQRSTGPGSREKRIGVSNGERRMPPVNYQKNGQITLALGASGMHMPVRAAGMRHKLSHEMVYQSCAGCRD